MCVGKPYRAFNTAVKFRILLKGRDSGRTKPGDVDAMASAQRRGLVATVGGIDGAKGKEVKLIPIIA
jgi:hypothetical protein